MCALAESRWLNVVKFTFVAHFVIFHVVTVSDTRMTQALSAFLQPAPVMPCPATTAEMKAAQGSGWKPHPRGTSTRATVWKMWSLVEGLWTTRRDLETACCQPLLALAQVRAAWKATGESKVPGSAYSGSRWCTVRRAAEGMCAIGGFRITCTTSWRDPAAGLSCTTPLCKCMIL